MSTKPSVAKSFVEEHKLKDFMQMRPGGHPQIDGKRRDFAPHSGGVYQDQFVDALGKV